jgi:prevent-host-death family protein
MTITTLSSREFNQDSSRAKKAARNGPVFITERGRPSHVLLSIEEYQRLTISPDSMVDLLAMPADIGMDFEPPCLPAGLFQAADLA